MVFLHFGFTVFTVVGGCLGLPSSSLLSVVEMDICKSSVGEGLVVFLFFLSSGWVVGCCTRSIVLVFGVCGCSLGDFFLVVIFTSSGLHFLGCSSSVILFVLDTGRVGGTSTGICLRPGTRTSTWAVSGVSVCLAVVMVTGVGTSLAAIFVVVGSGEDEDDLDEAGGVGSFDELGERVCLGGGGDFCPLRLGDVGAGDEGGEADRLGR